MGIKSDKAGERLNRFKSGQILLKNIVCKTVSCVCITRTDFSIYEEILQEVTVSCDAAISHVN